MSPDLKEERIPINICESTFEGPIGDIIAELEAVESSAGERGYKNIRIRIDSGYDNSSYEVIGDRPLTEKEITSRKKKAEAQRKATKAAKEKRLAKEKAEWERLNRKFAATGE